MWRLEASILDCFEIARSNLNTEQVFFKNSCSEWSLNCTSDILFVLRNNPEVARYNLATTTPSHIVSAIYALARC